MMALLTKVRALKSMNRLASNTLIFVEEVNAKQISVEAQVGQTILQIARKNKIKLDGVCEGGCACATCHVIVDKEHYSLFAKPKEEEEDCLDSAFGLTNTSRLACQIVFTEKCNGATISIPSATRNVNFGEKPK